jgi:hypothetical protein
MERTRILIDQNKYMNWVWISFCYPQSLNKHRDLRDYRYLIHYTRMCTPSSQAKNPASQNRRYSIWCMTMGSIGPITYYATTIFWGTLRRHNWGPDFGYEAPPLKIQNTHKSQPVKIHWFYDQEVELGCWCLPSFQMIFLRMHGLSDLGILIPEGNASTKDRQKCPNKL